MSSVDDEERTGNPDFDALIDLLGTDDPDDEPHAGDQSFAPVANLRTADGRFDFGAIREYFGANPRSPQSVEGQPQPLRLPTLTSQPVDATPEQADPVPHVSLPLPTPHFSPGRSFDQTFRSQTYLESPTPARLPNRLTSSTPPSRAFQSPERPASSLVPAVTTFDPEADAAALKAISPLSLPPAEVSPSPSREEAPSPIPKAGSRPLSRSLIKDEALAKSRPSTAPPDIFSGHKQPPEPAATTTPRPSHTRTSSQTVPWSSLKLPFPEIHFTAAATPSPAKPPTSSPAEATEAEANVPPPVPSPLAPKSKGKSPEFPMRGVGIGVGVGGGTPIVVPMPGGPLDDRDTSTEATTQLPAPLADYRVLADEIRRGFEENRSQASILDSALRDVRDHSSELAAQVAELQTIASHLNDSNPIQPPSPPLNRVPADDSSTMPGMDSNTAEGTSGVSGVDDDGGPGTEPEPEPASFGTWTSLDDDEMLAHAGAMVNDLHAHHHRQGAADVDNSFTDIDPLAEDTQTATQLPRFPSGVPLPSGTHSQSQQQPEHEPEPDTPQTASTSRAFGGVGDTTPMDEIELMSGHEARRTLRALLTALGLLPSLESSEQPIHEQLLSSVSSHHNNSTSTNSAAPSENQTRSELARPQSLEDVLRALEFVRSMDHLVWRGHRSQQQREGGVFGEKSVDSLKDRIQLWERAMRNPQVVPRIGVPSLRNNSGGVRIQTGQLRTSFGPGPSTSRSTRRERLHEDEHRY
ncbi:hypothetical protein M407DRAFT_23695 [Tulasnella calospora MUT 4182]|uniref:Uncharacterized protein n=1 Tax=Tulasnella calospora MUT 4182 TaxID=1051891 RepID=A0A0C3M033_9AGAM|nr:hypothetical protein M407DRAFT_23695 [Tulasnella calospora MUT 4182]